MGFETGMHRCKLLRMLPDFSCSPYHLGQGEKIKKAVCLRKLRVRPDFFLRQTVFFAHFNHKLIAC